MSIKRYIANSDTTITNAYKPSLASRGTGSNMGASDVLEIFSIYGQASATSSEESRVLVNFPISNITEDRTNGYIPQSGSVKFYLKMYNAIHSSTTPSEFTLVAQPVSSSWTEGFGLDMDEYKDLGVSNWVSSSVGNGWNSQGGDYLPSSSSQYFETGIENLEMDVTQQVEDWISNTITSNGFGLFLLPSEATSSISYYTKKFFSRTSEFLLWTPHIEARWNSQIEDDRGNFYVSSSLLSSENINTIYLYNYKNGKAINIPSVGTGAIYVGVYEALGASASILPTGGGVISGSNLVVTGGWTSTGTYTASFGYTGSASIVYDVWFKATDTFHTGAINVFNFDASNSATSPTYVLNINNGRQKYFSKENIRFRLFVREKDWKPTIYTVASTAIEPKIIEKSYYSLFRIQDGFEVVSYGTGSTQHTLLSFDVSGNYFDFDMSILEKGYMYGFKFAFDLQQNGQLEEQPYIFKFRVEE